MPTFHIETFGCQMNEHDSEGIAGILAGLGLQPVVSPQQADVVVLNTCSVRDKPHRKVFSRLQDLRRAKRERPDLLVIVAGCMAQLIPEEIRARAPHVDLLVGPGSYGQLEEAVSGLLRDGTPGAMNGAPTQIGRDESRPYTAPRELLDFREPDSCSVPYARAEAFRAWVNVMVGCDNHCAYCVVPRARGHEVSRKPEAVLAEIEALAGEGVVEVTLLGQNVNSYGRGLTPELDFADLLARVNAVEGLRRIRFTTSHPKDLSARLIAAMASLDRVCEHLHLPVQAGSDAVLARMGRGHTAAQYQDLVRAARTAIPGLALTTDAMVGFPGESAEDFGQTLALFEEVRFDQAFMFRYNDRPKTRASEFEPKVPEPEKQQRLQRLVEVQNRIAREINEPEVGRDVEVLVEGPDEKTPGSVRGRTRQNKLVILPGEPALMGQFVRARLTSARLWGWLGEPV
jgi:tRNA-2-methylthio-N6-dimethylallyladenosine synthase